MHLPMSMPTRYNLILAFTACTALPASAAPAETFGFDPDSIQVLQEQAVVLAGEVLHEALLQSHREALAAGVQPIPAAIRERLRGYYADSLLDRVRYRVGGGSDLSLQLNVIRYGDQAAITLGDVVVFAREADALHHVELWAHELWHVRQVQDWGLAGFAQRYARNYQAVEAEAELAAARYSAWVRTRGSAPQPGGRKL